MLSITPINAKVVSSDSRMSSGNVELRKLGFNRKELYSEIDINANPEKVWRILTDFEEYPDWNPFMRSMKGDLMVGRKLVVHLKPSGGRGISMKPTILAADRNHELRWIGHLGIPGLFDGEHTLEIQPIDGGQRVKFVQRELFGGIFLPFLTGMLKNDTARGFAEMNKALKERAERQTD
jgi:hypothetical protein